MTNIAVIYYSSTGNVYNLALGVAEGAEKGGAQVRLRGDTASGSLDADVISPDAVPASLTRGPPNEQSHTPTTAPSRQNRARLSTSFPIIITSTAW